MNNIPEKLFLFKCNSKKFRNTSDAENNSCLMNHRHSNTKSLKQKIFTDIVLAHENSTSISAEVNDNCFDIYRGP